METAAAKIIYAAGGLVINEKKEILFMFRRKVWDLPKGKVDPGETNEAAAVREVSEETGLQKVLLHEPLVNTHHTYEEKGKIIRKETHWYRMTGDSTEKLVPEESEGITALKWIGRSGLQEVLDNTYPNIIEVLKAGGYLPLA